MKQEYIIIGTGSQARVAASIIIANNHHINGFIEINNHIANNEMICGFPILGSMEFLKNITENADKLALAIGDNKTRAAIVDQLTHLQLAQKIVSIIHPTAHIEMNTSIAPMTTICMKSALAINARIGKGAIINSGAIIEHDCQIGEYAHISVGVCLAGNVTVDDFSFIGIGATVKERVTIGKHCMIGAGAVVLEDIPDYSVAVGVPAKIVKTSP